MGVTSLIQASGLAMCVLGKILGKISAAPSFHAYKIVMGRKSRAKYSKMHFKRLTIANGCLNCVA